MLGGGTQGDSGGGGGGGFVPLLLLRSAVFSHFRQGLFCKQDWIYPKKTLRREAATKTSYQTQLLQKQQQQRLLRLGPWASLRERFCPAESGLSVAKSFWAQHLLFSRTRPNGGIGGGGGGGNFRFSLSLSAAAFCPIKRGVAWWVSLDGAKALLGWDRGGGHENGIKCPPPPPNIRSPPPSYFGQHKQTKKWLFSFYAIGQKSLFFPACPPTLGVFWEPLPKYCSLFRGTIRVFPCAPPPFRQCPPGESGGGRIQNCVCAFLLNNLAPLIPGDNPAC